MENGTEKQHSALSQKELNDLFDLDIRVTENQTSVSFDELTEILNATSTSRGCGN
jgi:hypothetical protein